LNEHEEAARLYEIAIEGRKQIDGEDSVNYAMVMSMAAGSYREMG